MILKRLLPFVLIILVVLAVLPPQMGPNGGRVAAQGGTPDPTGVPVVIIGVVQSINGSTWIVDGNTVIVTSTTVITGYPVVGTIVKISGKRGDDGKVVVVNVTLTTATPAATEIEATEPPEGTRAPTAVATMAGTHTPTPAPTMAGTGVPFT